MEERDDVAKGDDAGIMKRKRRREGRKRRTLIVGVDGEGSKEERRITEGMSDKEE